MRAADQALRGSSACVPMEQRHTCQATQHWKHHREGEGDSGAVAARGSTSSIGGSARKAAAAAMQALQLASLTSKGGVLNAGAAPVDVAPDPERSAVARGQPASQPSVPPAGSACGGPPQLGTGFGHKVNGCSCHCPKLWPL